jgi:hypothetical protein
MVMRAELLVTPAPLMVARLILVESPGFKRLVLYRLLAAKSTAALARSALAWRRMSM